MCDAQNGNDTPGPVHIKGLNSGLEFEVSPSRRLVLEWVYTRPRGYKT